MTATESVSAGTNAVLLPAGTVVGGRFEVESVLAQDALGAILAAKDQKTQKPIMLRVLRPDLVAGDAGKALRADARTAAGLNHRSIVATYGVGTVGNGAMFVASEALEGQRLSDVIERRRAEGGHMSLRGAYNVIAHVCKALSYAQDQTCHGTLRPSVVWLGRSGRVKVAELGTSKALVAAHGAQVLGPAEQACLAPEVKGGAAPTVRSDIFGLGAILYQLLTGRSPSEGFVPPSQAHPDATPEIDRVLLKCLAARPEARFASPDEVRTALLPLVADAPDVAPETEFGMDVDIDVDLASVRPPTDPALPIPRVSVPKAAAVPDAGRPQVGQRVSLHEPFRPSIAETAVAPVAASVDLGAVLARITENDAPRWMAQKDNLDYGPYSGRELVGLLTKGEIRKEHGLLNMDTGERRKVAEWHDFADFAEAFEHKKAEEEHRAKLHVATKEEKRSSLMKVGVGVVLLCAAVGAGGWFLHTRKARQEAAVREQEVGQLFDIGEIQASASGDVLPDAPRHRGGGGGARGAGASGGGGGAGGSYEEAMNRAVDYGDLSRGGDMGQLTGPQVAQIMNQHIGRIYSACVPAEQARGGELGRVQVDIAIAGDGHVLGATARQGSPAFQACIGRQVASVRFPSFGAPRMGARYSFSAN